MQALEDRVEVSKKLIFSTLVVERVSRGVVSVFDWIRVAKRHHGLAAVPAESLVISAAC